MLFLCSVVFINLSYGGLGEISFQCKHHCLLLFVLIRSDASSSYSNDLVILIYQWIKQLNASLDEIDPEVADIIELEKARQWKVLIWIHVYYLDKNIV